MSEMTLSERISACRDAANTLQGLQDRASELPSLLREQAATEVKARAASQMQAAQERAKAAADAAKSELLFWRVSFITAVNSLWELCADLARINEPLHPALGALQNAVRAEGYCVLDSASGNKDKALYDVSLGMARRYGQLCEQAGLYDASLQAFPPCDPAVQDLATALSRAIMARVHGFYDPGTARLRGFK